MLKPMVMSLAVAAMIYTSGESRAQEFASPMMPAHGPVAMRWAPEGVGGAPGQLPPGAWGVMPQPRAYPQMHAPLYPCPVPNVPVQMGGTMYTNQALAPHEMLYPHKYKALFPPFYHKVRGKWWWTPFGMESHDHWELQGTEVQVNYRGHYRLFSGFTPPGKW
jgi:hypothetical protein